MGSIDLNIDAGTVLLAGCLVNIQGNTAFDQGSQFVSSTGNWQRVFFTNNTTQAGTFEIEVFTFPVGAAGGFDAGNLAFTAAPEPASLALLKPKRDIRIDTGGSPRR